MLGRLNHVAIAVPDLAAASAVYRDNLGAKLKSHKTAGAECYDEQCYDQGYQQ